MRSLSIDPLQFLIDTLPSNPVESSFEILMSDNLQRLFYASFMYNLSWMAVDTLDIQDFQFDSHCVVLPDLSVCT